MVSLRVFSKTKIPKYSPDTVRKGKETKNTARAAWQNCRLNQLPPRYSVRLFIVLVPFPALPGSHVQLLVLGSIVSPKSGLLRRSAGSAAAPTPYPLTHRQPETQCLLRAQWVTGGSDPTTIAPSLGLT